MVRYPEDRPSRALSRRDFLRRGATAAAAIPAASALLAACGKKTASMESGSKLAISTKEHPTPLPTFKENQPIASGLTFEKGSTLKLYNWEDYIYKKVVEDFQREFDVKVEITTFTTGEEALTKIRSSQVDFDVFVPTIDMMGKLAQFELTQPLNHEYLPNLKNLWPEFTDPGKPFYDVGQVYTVPYTVYTTGIGWRNDLLDPKNDPWHTPNPYDSLWDPKYRGMVGIYDDYREAMAMALLRNGETDVNTGDAAKLAAAKDALVELAGKVDVSLSIDGAYRGLPRDLFAIHQAWSGDLLAAMWYGKRPAAQTAELLSYWWPKDGKGVIGTDLIAILKSARNPVLAHTFLNYLLDFDVAMKNFSWNGWQPPQLQAQPETFLDPNFKWSWVVPRNLINCVIEHQDMETGYWIHELPPNVDQVWKANWEEFKAGI